MECTIFDFFFFSFFFKFAKNVERNCELQNEGGKNIHKGTKIIHTSSEANKIAQ